MPNFKWTQLTANGGFLDRDTPFVVEFKKRWWMATGWKYPGTTQLRDLLVCNQPGAWTMVNASVPFRAQSPVCVHNGLLWFVDDQVRSTGDGITYTTVAASVPFNIVNSTGDVKDGCALTSKCGKLHLIVGNGVWSTADGISWTFEAVGFGPLGCFSACEHAGRVYVVGGAIDVANSPAESGYPGKTAQNSVWWSDTPDDASKWYKMDGPFDERMWPAVCSHEDALWMVGGYNNATAGNLGDTWRFTDATGWERQWPLIEAPLRHGARLISQNEKLYLVAGNNNPYGTTNQVWQYEPILA